MSRDPVKQGAAPNRKLRLSWLIWLIVPLLAAGAWFFAGGREQMRTVTYTIPPEPEQRKDSLLFPGRLC